MDFTVLASSSNCSASVITCARFANYVALSSYEYVPPAASICLLLCVPQRRIVETLQICSMQHTLANWRRQRQRPRQMTAPRSCLIISAPKAGDKPAKQL
ncbi:unnamed protein product [Ceratitis capitata]|uniref:(Mediterranean fruit fly) hypothetical protein n=1 Tax=Ceratitis capitata TaxID=7213 RepID=A0A811V8R2_CERCA|nr:unnamed protein product [Ceratitis capitata]